MDRETKTLLMLFISIFFILLVAGLEIGLSLKLVNFFYSDFELIVVSSLLIIYSSINIIEYRSVRKYNDLLEITNQKIDNIKTILEKADNDQDEYESFIQRDLNNKISWIEVFSLCIYWIIYFIGIYTIVRVIFFN